MGRTTAARTTTAAGSGFGLTRRRVLALAGAAGALPFGGRLAAAVGAEWQVPGFSPIGDVRYGPGFAHFDYVNPDAPKGGRLRLTRIGAFEDTETLTYPARAPSDLRLIYDHLIVASDDEVASYYGLLADGLEVSDDYGEIVFHLHGDARWHDGQAVSAADVVFTLETLKAKGAPFYRQAFRPLSVEAVDARTVVVRNARTGDRDVMRRLATIPIHAEHAYRDGSPAAPLGSGPYRMATVEAPRLLVLERAADYWAAEHPVNRGRWNFDRIEIDYYRDANVALEAFKADEADVREEDSPTRWSEAYPEAALSSGAMRRQASPTLSVGALNGLVANLRRPLTADRRVRLALALAYDFGEANRLLFHGAYKPLQSVFAGTPLAAEGVAGEGERALLGADVDAATLADPDPFAGLPAPGSREALAYASRLLDEAGYPVVDGVRRDAAGAPMRLEVLLMTPNFEKPTAWLSRAARRLGVELVETRTDPATASRRMLGKDFDLAGLTWTPARLPGTAERLLWHSALADMPNSYALAGLHDPAVDRTIEALEQAADPDALAVAGRAFDRAFRHTLALIPLWRDDEVRTAWWDRFSRPAAEEDGFPPSPIDRWWA
ncbi:extracellular solute-binding protein [Acuticoccus mangrovi]|uniref:ABC transporter substrate-binding protein n=1 Tax=Acuticoccus mangrovi TaxID=2796142 RepID=A0A934ILB3_9HYPH|nr:extracellular solute-binding protein [Acuticoccus mangrovi]MBJ3774413.1 ABC transporter substrate-binding protein [Acuticoccus mangrovi]